MKDDDDDDDDDDDESREKREKASKKDNRNVLTNRIKSHLKFRVLKIHILAILSNEVKNIRKQ